MDRMMVLVALALVLIAPSATESLARGERPQVTARNKKARPASYFTIGIRLLQRNPTYLGIASTSLSA